MLTIYYTDHKGNETGKQVIKLSRVFFDKQAKKKAQDLCKDLGGSRFILENI